MRRRRTGLLLAALILVAVVAAGLQGAGERFWTLKCSVDRPWLLVVDDPAGTTRHAWVVTFRVTNPTDKTVFFLPYFLLSTETKKLYHNTVDFAAEREAERRLGRELANVVEVMGPLKPGETKEGLAVFPLPDPASDHFDLYVGGLSSEYRLVEREGASIVVRKMLLYKYYRPGDAYDIYLDTLQPVDSRWVWR